METEKAKKTIEDIFNFLNSPIQSIDYKLDENKGHFFSIKSEEFGKLALNYENLAHDLVYLLRRLFNQGHSLEEEIKYTIDINDLQAKEDNKIKLKALNAAEEARSLKTDIVLDSMSSYQRMLVHSTLAESPNIKTESFGEGRDRRVKIVYIV
jgi:spoIIIJ-associated protein